MKIAKIKLSLSDLSILSDGGVVSLEVMIGKKVKVIEITTNREEKIDSHHDRMHGLCIHGEPRGSCGQGGYSANTQQQLF